MKFLAIQGYKPHEILLDEVTEEGTCIRHLWRCDDRTGALTLANMVMRGHAATREMLGLDESSYTMVPHASERQTQLNPELVEVLVAAISDWHLKNALGGPLGLEAAEAAAEHDIQMLRQRLYLR